MLEVSSKWLSRFNKEARGVHPVGRFVGRRLLVGIFQLLLVSVLVFVGTELLIGDAATAILGPRANPSDVETLRDALGLNRPPVARYSDWLTGFVRGDLGETIGFFSISDQTDTPGQAISEVIAPKATNTIVLAGATMILLVPLGLGLGIVAGVRPGRAMDQIISNTTLVFVAVPEFVVATLLALLFGVTLRWLPPVSLVPTGSSPLATPSILVLPVATLLFVGVPYTARMMRANLAEVIDSEYVQMARLNGVREREVITRYGVRNALAPTVQVLALTLQWLVGGVVVVEAVFAYPGLGQALVEAVSNRDLNYVESVAMLIASLFIIINIVVDIAVMLLVPKLRTSM